MRCGAARAAFRAGAARLAGAARRTAATRTEPQAESHHAASSGASASNPFGSVVVGPSAASVLESLLPADSAARADVLTASGLPRTLVVGDMSSGTTPMFAGFPPRTPLRTVARSAMSLADPFHAVHQHLFAPSAESASGIDVDATSLRWHFIADVDAPLSAAPTKDALARRVLHAISTCLEFQGVGRIGEAAHRVLLLDGHRRDSYSFHVYVFIDPAARASFAAVADMAAFAAEVNACIGFGALDRLIYRANGSLRLPFSRKTLRDSDGTTYFARLTPLETSDPALLAATEWALGMSEADVVAACLAARLDGAEAQEVSHVSLKATTIPTRVAPGAGDASLYASIRAMDGDAEPATVEQRRDLLRAAEALVTQLPDEASVPYSDWSRVKLAIRAVTGNEESLAAEGLRIFDVFSARCPEKYNARTVAKTFASRLRTMEPLVGVNMLKGMLREYHDRGLVTADAMERAGVRLRPGASAAAVDGGHEKMGAEPKTISLEEANRLAEEWTF